MIRMAWHSAGTYRIHDGRGGAGVRDFVAAWDKVMNLDRSVRRSDLRCARRVTSTCRALMQTTPAVVEEAVRRGASFH